MTTMYVRNMARRFHRSKRPMLLVKLDISKVFGSVRWDYLFSLLNTLGFPRRWVDWIAALLSTASSQVLLNGIPGEPFVHGRGLLGGGPALPFALHSRHRPAPEASPGCNGQGANF